MASICHIKYRNKRFVAIKIATQYTRISCDRWTSADADIVANRQTNWRKKEKEEEGGIKQIQRQQHTKHNKLKWKRNIKWTKNVHAEQQGTRSCESKNKNRTKFNPCGKQCSSSVAFFLLLSIPHSNSKKKMNRQNEIKQQNFFFIAN